MALVLANRVQETTTTTGTGTITLAGAVAGFQSFAVIGDGNTTYYTITSGTAWEVGIGTYTASGTTLARTTILSSSAGGAAITLAGTSAVFVAYPADKSVNYDASNNVGIGTSSPGKTLDLVGQFRASGSAASGYALLEYGTSATATNNWHVGSEGDGTFRWYNGNFGAGTERMRITSAGFVGIGTSAPSTSQILTLNSGGTATPANGGLAGLGIINTDVTTSGTTGVIASLTDPGGTGRHAAAIAFGKDGTWTAGSAYPGNIQFWTRPNSTASEVERMRIDSSGNVGIGTTAPLGRLQAVGSAYFGAGPSDATNATLAAYSDGTGISIEAFQGNSSATKRNMWLAAYGGNVGIGALFPSAKLDVLGDFVARTDASGGNTPLNVKNDSIATNTTKSTALRFQGVDTVGTSKNVGLVQCGPSDVNYVTSYLAFQTRTADALSERMRITDAGNVGIGTSSPTFRLVSANSSTDGGWLYSSGAVSILGLGGYSGASDGAFSLRYDRTTGDITFNGGSRDTPTERMRIGGSGNLTLANKIIPNVQSIASAGTITPNANTDTQVSVTALAVPATIASPSGTPSDGQTLIIRIEDNGTARALTWTTGSSGAYRAVGITLPTTTVATKVLYVGCKYNSTDLRWDAVALSQEA